MAPNGDVNPYGVALIPSSAGKLQAGNLLVSNFNDKENNQGTGATIVQLAPAGKSTLFATIDANTLPGSCPGGVGLTTALNILPGGYVVVGSLPTTDGKSATAKPGCLIVLDSNGNVLKTIAGANIQGPWDSTAVSEGAKTTLFVSNVLNGGAAKGVHTINNSTVVRIVLESGPGQPPKVVSQQVIADHIPWRDSPEALVVGPTGVALASSGTLYLADTLANRITAIPQAMTRTTPAPGGGATVSAGGHLKEPLGLAIAPGGDIITTNAGDGNMVETTPAGQQVAVRTADAKTGAGSLFGLVVAPEGRGVYFVDDGENKLNLLHESQSMTATPPRTTATPVASPPAKTSSSAASAASPVSHSPASRSKASPAPPSSRSTASSTPSTSHPTASPAPQVSRRTQPSVSPRAGSGEALGLETNREGRLKYSKTSLTAQAGKVSIDFTNMAPLGHNLTIESASGERAGATPTFQGGSRTLTLNLKPGTYKFFCSVPGHRMAGMEGTLTIK